VSIPLVLFCQINNVKKLVSILRNDKLEFEVANVGGIHSDTSGPIVGPSVLLLVSSINVDSLLRKYGKRDLLFGLIKALDNKSCDWYANALLYDITKRKDCAKFLFIKSRQKWLKEEKANDVAYWENFKKELKR